MRLPLVYSEFLGQIIFLKETCEPVFTVLAPIRHPAELGSQPKDGLATVISSIIKNWNLADAADECVPEEFVRAHQRITDKPTQLTHSAVNADKMTCITGVVSP